MIDILNNIVLLRRLFWCLHNVYNFLSRATKAFTVIIYRDALHPQIEPATLRIVIQYAHFHMLGAIFQLDGVGIVLQSVDNSPATNCCWPRSL